ncbi:Spc7 kinetochore protein-domain-containing protein [Irpex rosettiformis]|uniref:Spc7 kinetochore protein-domain-containing protein n=1 Tax=Irpex rosettiformis TaxID=378272 RepID=A0ACB8ULQ1_9APHY|nr:Spc7 kinetochore protein-domain-containing protein [Irpex rosettiformis]
MPHISPNRRRSIAVLGNGSATSRATQKRRRAYSIAPGEKLSPAARARNLAPRKSILKGSVSARPSQESTSADDTGSNNITMSMDFTEVVRNSVPRKSLGRRVSFASHAHVRLFEKQDPNTSGDLSKSGSEDGGDSAGEEDPVELDFLNEDEADTPHRPFRRRSSTGFSELGEQSMSMDLDADDTGPIPQDFLDGPALDDEKFANGANGAYGDDMDMTEVIPGSIKPRPSLGIENIGVPGKRRSSAASLLTSSHSQRENQVSRKPLGVISQSSGMESQQRLYPSLDDVPDPSASPGPIPPQDPDVSLTADLSDMDLTVGSTVEPTISSVGDDNTQPMEFTIPVVRPPPPPSEAWLTLRAMTHAGAEPYVPPEIEALDDPEANAIVSGNDHPGELTPDRSDQEDNDSMDLTVALSRLAQARPSLGLPALSDSFSLDEDEDGGDDDHGDSFTSRDASLEADMSLDGNQTVNLTNLRLSLGRTAPGDASMELTNVYGQHFDASTADDPETDEIVTPEAVQVTQLDGQQPSVRQHENGQEKGQEQLPPPKLPIFTLTKSQSSTQPLSQQPNELQHPFKPSIPLPIFTLAPTTLEQSHLQHAPQTLHSPNKSSTDTTVPTPFTFSVPSKSNARGSPAKTTSTSLNPKTPPPSSSKKLPIFRGSAAFAPPSIPKSPRKRPAPPNDGDGHAPSPAKKQAVEKQFVSNKPQATLTNESALQNRRLSAVRRPSGYFAQRKSLGSAGAPPSVPSATLSKSTSAPVSINSSSQMKPGPPAPPSPEYRSATDKSSSSTSNLQQSIEESPEIRDTQDASHSQAREEEVHSQIPEFHFQQAPSLVQSSPGDSTPPLAHKQRGSIEASLVFAPEQTGSNLESGRKTGDIDQDNLDEEDMGMTNRWREGLTDGELNEEDEPTISIEQFFEMTNIRFMDEITAPRRSMIHPGQLGLRNRRRSLTSHSEETEHIPLAEFMVAMALDVPELELYHDLAGQLTAWVEESKKICRQAEEDAIKVTPALFREFAEADELEKQDLLHQLKLIKANNIDRAKSQWYEWKSNWVAQLQESAEEAFGELESDAKTLEGIINQAQNMLPSLRDEYAQIMAELEKEEADIVEIENSDKNFLSDLKVSIAEQDVEVQALQANVSEAQAKLNRLQERDAETELQKEELESAIARGEEQVQRQTESTSLKVLRLKDELESLEDLHLWRAIKLDAHLKEFLYASRIKVSIPCVAHRPEVSLLHVERTKASRMKERDEFSELSELMLTCAPHVTAASRKGPDLRAIIQRLSDFWASCAQIRLQLTFLAVQYPLELKLLPGENGLPTFEVSTKVLFPSVKSKANIKFIFDSDTYLRWPLSIGLLKCDVQVAYGRADRQKILSAVQSRLSQATSSENHGCMLDACIEATEQLAFA